MKTVTIEKEYNVKVRKAKPEDYVTWANGTAIKRVDGYDYRFELNDNSKVYILEKIAATTRQVVGVVDKPSEELLQFISDYTKEE